jgi:hypothetical protein
VVDGFVVAGGGTAGGAPTAGWEGTFVPDGGIGLLALGDLLAEGPHPIKETQIQVKHKIIPGLTSQGVVFCFFLLIVFLLLDISVTTESNSSSL